MNFQTYNHRFAEEILNSRLYLRRELEGVIEKLDVKPKKGVQKEIQSAFESVGWSREEKVMPERNLRYDLYKDHVAVEIQTSHRMHCFKDYLKFLTGQNLGKVDVGVEMVWSNRFARRLELPSTSPRLSHVRTDLELFSLILPVPIYAIGLGG